MNKKFSMRQVAFNAFRRHVGSGYVRFAVATFFTRPRVLLTVPQSSVFNNNTPYASPQQYPAQANVKTDVQPEAQIKADEKDDVTVTDAKGNTVSVSPLHKFDDLKEPAEWLSRGLQQLGFPSTTLIQKYTIPVLEEGHDLIGLAPTGSGKTVAFAVPALKRIKRSEDGAPSVLVLAPTRELVQQTTRVFEGLSAGAVRVCEAYGGTPREVQARRLHQGCDVLVACPGRLKDFLDSGDTSLKNLSFIVFDEADRLLDMGFQIQLDEILNYLDPSVRVQTMMWSATWPRSVQDLARNYLSPERLTIQVGTAGTGRQVNAHIRQHILFVDLPNARVEKLVSLIESGEIDDNNDKLILFVERQSDTDEVAHALSQRLGIDSRYVGVIHGGLSQRLRDIVMNRFKSNRTRILVATDVASRGLDIPDVTCVVNMQAPKNIDSYCHRIGRTGRAGRSGKAYTFISKGDEGIAGELADYLRSCKMEVPQQLSDLAEAFASTSQYRQRSGRGWGGQSNRRSNFNRSGSRDRRGNNFSNATRNNRASQGWPASNRTAGSSW